MPDIEHEITIKAYPDQVFEALTTTDGLRGWWTRDAMIGKQTGEVAFMNRKVITKIKVVKLVQDKHVGWQITDSNAPGGWGNSTITFDLSGETTVKLAHRRLSDDGEGFALTNDGWKFYLESLKKYLETGAGTPK